MTTTIPAVDLLHVSNWKHLIPAAEEQDDEKHDWDNLDFGTIEEAQCGLCGCKSDNGMWDENGDLLEDVICDDCDKEWCYDEDRDAYVPRELTHFTLPEKQFISSIVDEMISKAMEVMA